MPRSCAGALSRTSPCALEPGVVGDPGATAAAGAPLLSVAAEVPVFAAPALPPHAAAKASAASSAARNPGWLCMVEVWWALGRLGQPRGAAGRAPPARFAQSDAGATALLPPRPHPRAAVRRADRSSCIRL